MSETKPSREDGQRLVSQLMGEPAQSDDPLVDEMRGPVNPENAESSAESGQDAAEGQAAGSPGTDPEPLDTPNDILQKLRKARQEAGSAGYQLGKAREELAEKDQRLAALEAEVAAIRAGASPVAGANAGNQDIVRLTDGQLDQLMSQFDEDWEESRQDPYKLNAARNSANMAMTLYSWVQNQLGEVTGGVENMQFDQRLSRLGIDRAQFDSVWKDPAYAWGASLSNSERLAALETQAGTLGSLPHTEGGSGGMPSNQPVARPTSRVSPRTIETSQGVGSAANPVRLRELELQKSLDNKDFAGARRAAAPLFERLMAGG